LKALSSKDQEDEEVLEELSTLDNMTSAIGKFIEADPALANEKIVNEWFEQLPLKEDKDEGVLQGKILAKILVKEQYAQVKEMLVGAKKAAVLETLDKMIGEEDYKKISDELVEAKSKLSQ